MNTAIVGLYGIYFVLCGVNGNAGTLFKNIATEKKFVPWIVAVLILGFLDNESETKPLVAPFITLLAVTLLVTKWSNVSTQVKQAYGTLSGAAGSASTGASQLWQQFQASPINSGASK